MYQQYRPTREGMPVVVKNLLIINFLMFLITIVLRNKFNIDLEDILGLHNITSSKFNPIQLITHMFMHATHYPNSNEIYFWHIAFNMFGLWMFGSFIERFIGSKRFLILYFAAGLGAAFIQLGVNGYEIAHFQSLIDAYTSSPSINTFNDIDWNGLVSKESYESLFAEHQKEVINPGIINKVTDFLNTRLTAVTNGSMVGASGAIYGIMVAFATLFPNTLLYLYFAIPVKAKWAITGLIAFDLIGGLSSNPGDNVAHFAHLGGALVGFLMVRYWNKNNRKTLF